MLACRRLKCLSKLWLWLYKLCGGGACSYLHVVNNVVNEYTISFFSEVQGGGDGGESSSIQLSLSGGDGFMSAAVEDITGAVCGLYGVFVVVGSASVLIISWLQPLMTGKHALLVQPITVNSPLKVVTAMSMD